MRLWQDGIIAFLASIGTASILWGIARLILFAPPRRQDAVALICARGNGGDLEAQVRALTLLRNEQGMVGEILLVDCGLSEEGRTLCRLLSREHRRVSLVAPDDIPTYLT